MNLQELTGQKLHFFHLAERMANQSVYGKMRHGAILVKGGSVLSMGMNKSNFSSFGQRFRHASKGQATLHAEIDCILGLDKNMTKSADLYVVRTNSNKELCQSKPCPMCQSVLSFMGIYRVYWSVSPTEWDSYKVG